MTQDPYVVGYELGVNGKDLPDEYFSLFSWLGWVQGMTEFTAQRQSRSQLSNAKERE